jgi:hypothetical protein
VDPRLSAALKSAGDEGTVEAVLMFDNPASASGNQNSDRIRSEISRIAGEAVEANYFPNLGSVAVRAKGRVVRKLLRQPGLAVASLNRL